jgi:hypothetical protein
MPFSTLIDQVNAVVDEARPHSRFPLIERLKPRPGDEPPVVLEEDQAALVREFISVAKSQGQIESEGVHSSISLLMTITETPWFASSRINA